MGVESGRDGGDTAPSDKFRRGRQLQIREWGGPNLVPFPIFIVFWRKTSHLPTIRPPLKNPWRRPCHLPLDVNDFGCPRLITERLLLSIPRPLIQGLSLYRTILYLGRTESNTPRHREPERNDAWRLVKADPGRCRVGQIVPASIGNKSFSYRDDGGGPWTCSCPVLRGSSPKAALAFSRLIPGGAAKTGPG